MMNDAEAIRNPKALLACVRRREAINEAVHDQTPQRRFERAFLSSDVPDANGDPYDYGDGGRAVARILGGLDAPFRARRRADLWQAALAQLEGHPELRRTLVAIRRHHDRVKIISALKIKDGTYRERLSQLTNIFES